MEPYRVKYSKWKFFRSVVAPPFLFTLGIAGGFLGFRIPALLLLSSSGALLRWAVAKSFVFDDPPLVFSKEGVDLKELVNVGFTPWQEVRNLMIHDQAGLLQFEALKSGYWLSAAVKLKDYDIGDGWDFRRRVRKYAEEGGALV